MDAAAQKAISDFLNAGKSMTSEPEERKVIDFPKAMEAAGIPKRYCDASFEKLGRDGCPDEVRAMATEAYTYAMNLKENAAAGKGLFFFGEVGRMKTTLAVCVAREAIKQGMGVYFISMPELLATMVSMSKNRDGTELQRFRRKIKQVTMLVLDDFGAEYANEWVKNQVDAIITSRYNDMKPVIVTTNMLPNEIKDRYVQRVYDRLRSSSKALGAYGDSLRKSAE